MKARPRKARRGTRTEGWNLAAGAGAPILLALAVLQAACGGGDGPVSLTPPDEEDPPPAAEVVGDTVYAVTLGNRLLVLGTESYQSVSGSRRIRGVPILERLVGIDWRPSNGKLYGVGTDSRVYTLDLETATATPVSPEPFSPRILGFLDTHFGMGFDPVTDRIRLIAAESELNWSIDPDDGTAVPGEKAHYAPGDPNEGVVPRISGLAFPPRAAEGSELRSALQAELAARVGPLDYLDCDRALYALDADLGWLVGTCDPDRADFVSLVDLDLEEVTRCGEVQFNADGDLFLNVMEAVNGLNRIGRLDPERGVVLWYEDAYDPADPPPHPRDPPQAWVFDLSRALPCSPGARCPGRD